MAEPMRRPGGLPAAAPAAMPAPSVWEQPPPSVLEPPAPTQAAIDALERERQVVIDHERQSATPLPPVGPPSPPRSIDESAADELASLRQHPPQAQAPHSLGAIEDFAAQQASKIPPPPRPRPWPVGAGGGGMRRESLPAELNEYGGFYYGPGYLDDLEAARASGKVSDSRAADLMRQYEVSPLGREGQLKREAEELKIREGEQVAGAHREAMAEQAEIRRREQAMHEAYFAEHQRQIDSYKLAAEDLASTRIDTKRFWKEQGTGLTILAAISAGLGAAAASMTGGPNTALNIIEGQVNKDIAAQEKDLETKKTGVDAKYSLLGMMRQHFSDKQEATAAARAYSYNRLADQIQMYKAATYPDKIRNDAAVLETGFRQKAAAEQKLMQQRAAAAAAARANDALKAQQEHRLNEWALSKGLLPYFSMSKEQRAIADKLYGIDLDARKLAGEETKVSFEAQAKSGEASAKLAERLVYVEGKPYIVKDKQSAEKLIVAENARQGLIRQLNNMEALVDDAGVIGLVDPTKRDAMNAASTMATVLFKNGLYGMAEPNEARFRQFEAAMPQLNAYAPTIDPWRPEKAKQRINALRELVQGSVDDTMRAMAATPAEHSVDSAGERVGFSGEQPGSPSAGESLRVQSEGAPRAMIKAEAPHRRREAAREGAPVDGE